MWQNRGASAYRQLPHLVPLTRSTTVTDRAEVSSTLSASRRAMTQ